MSNHNNIQKTSEQHIDLVLANARIVSMVSGAAGYTVSEPTHIHVCDRKIVKISDEIPTTSNIYDCKNQLVTPGFIDCHTHLIYAGNRANEFEMRLNGVPYQEIAKQGGGILSTVRATR
ncbi:imidazolonepropionase, partial [Vibrio xuii]